MNGLDVSLIVPTYNRRASLAQVLDRLAHQSYPADRFEVLVVSDGSTDGTDQLLRAASYPFALVPIFQANQGVAVARNNGVAEARADNLLFIDDDVVPSPELIEEHMSLLAQDDCRVILGPMVTPPDARLSPWIRYEQRMLEKQYQDMIQGRWQATARQFYTGNTSVGRRHVLAAGGFDPAFRRAEDVELAYRLKELGLTFIFNPRAIGYHYAERSFASWKAIGRSYGRNDVIMARQKGQRWLLDTVLREYGRRSLPVRLVTRLGLGRPAVARSLTAGLELMMRLADRLDSPRLVTYACSGIFNLEFYQGMAEELGGPDRFWQEIARV
jgi:glycosyltransferase involved in cell wall biosynthesis